MSAEEKEDPPVENERRNYKRRHVLWQAKLQCGNHEFDCWVYNMSLSGAEIRFDLPISPDYGVVLVIIYSTNGVIPWLVTLGGMAWLNYVGVRRFRVWSAPDPSRGKTGHSCGLQQAEAFQFGSPPQCLSLLK